MPMAKLHSVTITEKSNYRANLFQPRTKSFSSHKVSVITLADIRTSIYFISEYVMRRRPFRHSDHSQKMGNEVKAIYIQ